MCGKYVITDKLKNPNTCLPTAIELSHKILPQVKSK